MYILVIVIMNEINFRFARQTAPGIGYINMYGVLPNNPGIPIQKPRVLTHFAFVYVTSGSGILKQYGQTYEIRPGSLFFLFPNVPHSYSSTGERAWSEIYIGFGGPVFDCWQAQDVLTETNAIHSLTPINLWSKRLLNVITSDENSTPLNMARDVCRLQNLLCDILFSGNNTAKADEEWLTQIQQTLEAAPSIATDFKSFATELGMSYENFRKKFTRIAGTSPNKFMSGLVTDKACNYLSRTDMTLRQIAELLGFCDEYHFAKRFKQLTGQTPGTFRKQYKTQR